MILFVESSDVQSLFWLVIFLATFMALLLVLLFWIHRRNNYQRFLEMEQKMRELEETIFRLNAQPKDNFKIALQQHLQELTSRITKNEEKTHHVFNQLSLLEEMMDDSADPQEAMPLKTIDQTPAGDSGITIQQIT